jgi:hypothetical protein
MNNAMIVVIDVCARIPRYAYADLEARGYSVRRSPYSYEIASVHAINVEFSER